MSALPAARPSSTMADSAAAMRWGSRSRGSAGMLWDDPFWARAGRAGATSAGGSSCNMLRRVKRAVDMFIMTIVSYAARRPEIIGRAARLGCNDLRERCTRPEPRTAAAGPQSRVYPVGGSRAGGRHRDQYGGLHRLQGDGGAAAGRARPVDHGEPGAEARARQRAVVIQLSGL